MLEGVAVAVVMLAASAAVLTVLVLRIPADFLLRPPTPPQSGVFARVGKNALGILLVIAGLVMSIPGIPGQGVLTS